MATMDTWRERVIKRFPNESVEQYGARCDRILEIQVGFRMGRFRGDEAEAMDRELGILLNQRAMRQRQMRLPEKKLAER